ncbi:hypothetical protein EW026_g6139 [Hermanssonia centrifuga]|uniref:Pre-mRNA-splicing factor PRP46 n=1 Tax=Hermanssonia centrifuga TaxID=98765 RepID=A0A4S4KBY3_9APHY|nr:hypothetical protein EW026_g6139 [Hermanssonia centrifuga]
MDASSLPPLNSLLKASGKRTWDVFASCPDDSLKEDEKIARVRLSVKISDEYKDARELPASLLAQQGQVGPARPKEQRKMITAGKYSFASASAGGNNIKKWKCPEGAFVFNFSGHNAIINTLSVNSEGVFFSGGDNGTLTFWDYDTGTAFQNLDDIPQPGSLEAEAGVFCSTFDATGTRLITGGADKTIKIYAEQSR